MLEASYTDAKKFTTDKKSDNEITSDVVNMVGIPYADALRQKNRKDEAQEIIDEIENKGSSSWKVLYNLACYYSNSITLLKDLDPKRKDLQKELNKAVENSLKYYKYAIFINPVVSINAKGDTSLDGLREKKKADYLKINRDYGCQIKPKRKS